ncbi:MAG: nucleotide sugar dehydrogenase [Chloroflexota bacterium]
MSNLATKIANQEAVVGIVGLGYVGLPLAVGFGRIGFSILGIDLSEDKVNALNDGHSYIPDVPSDQIQSLQKKERFIASTSYDDLTKADVIFICVPTPFDAQKAPDLSFIESASSSIAKVLRSGQLIILQSTTYPGTTKEIVLPPLQSTGLQVGRDFYLAFSPERIDPGQVSSAGFDVVNTPKVVGGMTERCTQLAADFLAKLTPEVCPVSSPEVAEMCKLLENTFRSVNIALVNELTLLSDRMGIDIWEVINAAKTKPFGFMPFEPGPGVGGHCIPVDPYYLSWKAREFDFYTKFIELAAEVNSDMPYFTVQKIGQALNDQGISLKAAKILILGVAFKRDIDDARNSPAERVIELLLKAGADVCFHDPFVDQFSVGNNVFLREKSSIPSVDLTENTMENVDCAVIITNHSGQDYEWVAQHCKLLFDTRNATQALQRRFKNIIRLGAPAPV